MARSHPCNAFFFNDTATTEIYTLPLHDALPISVNSSQFAAHGRCSSLDQSSSPATQAATRSEEHTSELQSRPHLVCRLLLDKKKKHSLSKKYGRNARN